MSNNSAILLTIFLEGVLSQVKEEVIINVTEEKEFMVINPETKLPEPKILTKHYDKQHFQRTAPMACKKTTISEASVNYMLSNETPDWYKAKWNQHKQWFDLTDDEKLNQHFSRMAHPHKFSYTFIG